MLAVKKPYHLPQRLSARQNNAMPKLRRMGCQSSMVSACSTNTYLYMYRWLSFYHTDRLQAATTDDLRTGSVAPSDILTAATALCSADDGPR